MNYFKRAHTLYIEPLTMILIGIVVAGLLGGHFVNGRLFGGVKVTPGQIYAAEQVYQIALIGADNYITACFGDKDTGVKAVLPATCVSTAEKVQSAVRASVPPYQTIMGYEMNPPANAASAFLAAVDILQAAIPAAYLPK